MKLFGWSFSITNAVFYLKACPDDLTTKWMLPWASIFGQANYISHHNVIALTE